MWITLVQVLVSVICGLSHLIEVQADYILPWSRLLKIR